MHQRNEDAFSFPNVMVMQMENRIAGLEQRSLPKTVTTLKAKPDVKQEQSLKLEHSAIATTPSTYHPAADVIATKDEVRLYESKTETKDLSVQDEEMKTESEYQEGRPSKKMKKGNRSLPRSVPHLGYLYTDKKKKKKDQGDTEMQETEISAPVSHGAVESEHGHVAEEDTPYTKSKKKRKGKDEGLLNEPEKTTKKQKKEESSKKVIFQCTIYDVT